MSWSEDCVCLLFSGLTRLNTGTEGFKSKAWNFFISFCRFLQREWRRSGWQTFCSVLESAGHSDIWWDYWPVELETVAQREISRKLRDFKIADTWSTGISVALLQSYHEAAHSFGYLFK